MNNLDTLLTCKRLLFASDDSVLSSEVLKTTTEDVRTHLVINGFMELDDDNDWILSDSGVCLVLDSYPVCQYVSEYLKNTYEIDTSKYKWESILDEVYLNRVTVSVFGTHKENFRFIEVKGIDLLFNGEFLSVAHKDLILS